MECNKEEAVRARGIAEQKMQNGDFKGAKKFALKAQKLFPELENIPQLLTICNVHYCAKNKLFGSEMDWYGILQIEQSADETSIKKQYRKLALLLHPDKNKFAGAEAAFKLIGEANRVLADQTNRSQYDLKCKISVETAPKSASHPSNKASMDSQYEFTFTASYSYQQAQHRTFWTLCSACGIKYQYYFDCLNRLLNCKRCGSSFIAFDLGTYSHSWSQCSSQKEIPNQGPCNVPSECNGGSHFSHGLAGSAHIPKAGNSHDGFTANRKVDGFSNTRDKEEGVDMPKPNVTNPKASGTLRNAKKRGWTTVEECAETADGAGQEDCGNNSGLNSNANASHPARRSARQKPITDYFSWQKRA